MTPTKFKECNITFAEDQPEYEPLPALRLEDGQVFSLWKMSFKERIICLFTGRVWLMLLTFNGPLQPSLLSVEKPFTSKRKVEKQFDTKQKKDA